MSAQGELGCTINLRGGDDETLSSVKNILRFAVYAGHNMHLEMSCMADSSMMVTSDEAIKARPAQTSRFLSTRILR